MKPQGQRNRSKNRKKRPLPEQRAPLHEKIALIGFRGVGKSTIARHLEETWHMKRISLDSLISERENSTIEKLVEEKGWDAFRAAELRALEETSKTEGPLLLDAGGGILEDENRGLSGVKLDLLRRNFFVIYLYMSDERLLRRLAEAKKNSHRPGLGGGESLEQVLERRKPWYQQAAHAIVDVSDVTSREAAERISQLLKSRAAKAVK